MTNIARGAAGRKPLPSPSTQALALLDRLAGGAVPLAELRDPADRTGLDNLSRRGAVKLLLGLGGEVLVVRTRP